MKRPMYEVNVVIKLGAEICKRLKTIYFPTEPWSQAYQKKIPELFTRLKREARARAFGEGLNEPDFLRFLITCTNDDYKDLINEA